MSTKRIFRGVRAPPFRWKEKGKKGNFVYSSHSHIDFLAIVSIH